MNLDQLREQLVVPFYLDMMSTNATEHGARLLPAIATAGRTATADDVVALLRDPWRATVMGAWYAVLHDDEEVAAVLLEAVSESEGSLTAPVLATAAILVSGRQALPALEAYMDRDIDCDWGAGGFVAAAIEYAGGSSARCQPSDVDRRDFSDLLALAERLRAMR